MSSNINLITQFDREYPEEDTIEGIAVAQAVAFGKCCECRYYKQCGSDDVFQFPPDAWCMRLKKKMMEADYARA